MASTEGDKLKLLRKIGLKIDEWLKKYKGLVKNFLVLFATEHNPSSRERELDHSSHMGMCSPATVN